MNAITLAPCPFCGQSVICLTTADFSGVDMEVSCQTKTCILHQAYFLIRGKSREDCAARWNARPAAPSAPPSVPEPVPAPGARAVPAAVPAGV